MTVRNSEQDHSPSPQPSGSTNPEPHGPALWWSQLLDVATTPNMALSPLSLLQSVTSGRSGEPKDGSRKADSRGRTGAQALEWLMRWLPAVLAAQSLARSLASLAVAARRDWEADTGKDAPPQQELAQALEELQEQVRGLVEAFPDASHWFFGAEQLDGLVRELAMRPEGQAGLKWALETIEARIGAGIARLVDLALSPQSPVGPSPQEMRRFFEQAEVVVDWAMKQWFWPHFQIKERP